MAARLHKSSFNGLVQTWRVNLNDAVITIEQVIDACWDEVERIVETLNSPVKIQLTMCANITHLPAEEVGKIYLRSCAFVHDENSREFFLQLFHDKLQSYSDRSSNFRINKFEFVDFDLIKYNDIAHEVGH